MRLQLLRRGCRIARLGPDAAARRARAVHVHGHFGGVAAREEALAAHRHVVDGDVLARSACRVAARAQRAVRRGCTQSRNIRLKCEQPLLQQILPLRPVFRQLPLQPADQLVQAGCVTRRRRHLRVGGACGFGRAIIGRICAVAAALRMVPLQLGGLALRGGSLLGGAGRCRMARARP